MSGRSGLTGDPPDDIDRSIAELHAELAKPARFREPSAAERARKPVQPSGPAGLRRARQARKLRKPVAGPPAEPWRGWSPSPGKGRRRATSRLIIGVLIVAIVGGGAFYAVPRLGRWFGSGRQVPLTVGPRTAGLPSPTVAEPFAGSPAQSYASGAAGIVIPAAAPAGRYSAAQVAAAYQTTKQLLVAAYLNLPTVNGGSPAAFAALLIPRQRTIFLGNLRATGTATGSTRAWVTAFAPGNRLTGNVIKVHGAMRAVATTSGGTPVLQVHTDYLFVYPVEHEDNSATLMRVVARYVTDVDFAAWDDPGGALEPWWSGQSAIAGELCGYYDGYIHPSFASGPQPKVRPTGTPVDPYSQSTPLPGKCQNTTGT